MATPVPLPAPAGAALKPRTLETVIEALDAPRRRIYVSGIFMLVAGSIAMFASWNYPGSIIALAAGSIAADSFVTGAKLRARAEGRIGVCACSRAARRGEGSATQRADNSCGAVFHLYGLSIALIVLCSVFFVAAGLVLLLRSSLWRVNDCTEYTRSAFQAACDAATSPTGTFADHNKCREMQYCAEYLYEMVISCLSIVMQAALIAAAAVMLEGMTHYRRELGSSPFSAFFWGSGMPLIAKGDFEESGAAVTITNT